MEKNSKTGPRKFNKESQERYINNNFWVNCEKERELQQKEAETRMRTERN